MHESQSGGCKSPCSGQLAQGPPSWWHWPLAQCRALVSPDNASLAPGTCQRMLMSLHHSDPPQSRDFTTSSIHRVTGAACTIKNHGNCTDISPIPPQGMGDPGMLKGIRMHNGINDGWLHG